MTETIEPIREFQVRPVGCQVNEATVLDRDNAEISGSCGFWYGPEANQQPAYCEQCLDETRRLNALLQDFTVEDLRTAMEVLTGGADDDEDEDEPHRHYAVISPEQQIRYMVEVVAEAEARLEQAGLPVMALTRWLHDALDLRDLRIAHEHGHLEPQTIYEDDQEDA